MKRLRTFFVFATCVLAGTVSITTSSYTYASENKGSEIIQATSHVEESPFILSEMNPLMDKMKSFATVMNMYSAMLNRGLDITFELKGHENLLQQMKNNQASARNHANDWENTIKKMLVDTIQNFLSYDKEFQKQFQMIVDIGTVDNIDKPILLEKVKALKVSLQPNQEQTKQLITALKQFKADVDGDIRNLTRNMNEFINIFQSAGVEAEDDDVLEEKLLRAWDRLGSITSFGIPYYPPSYIEQSKKETRQLFFYKRNMPKVLEGVSEAIDVLDTMSAHWYSVDSKYEGLMNSINKVSTTSFAFIRPQLNAVQDSWNALKIYVMTLNEGIKELK